MLMVILLDRYHYVDEAELVRAALNLYGGIPGSIFRRPQPEQDYYEISPSANKLLCAHLTPTTIIAALKTVVWQANCLGYLREFVRRVDQREDVGQGSQVGMVLEGFVEGVNIWLWEVGGEISSLEHRLYKEQLGHDDDQMTSRASTLLGLINHLRPILSPALGLSTLLRETVQRQAGQTTRLRVWTGQFLSGMYRLVEREALLESSTSGCLDIFVDLFFRSLRPYLCLIDQWATEGPAKDLDARKELMLDATGGLLYMEAVPCFLRDIADDIMAVGEEVEFLRRVQGEERRGSLAGRRVWVYKRGWRRERVNVQSRRRKPRRLHDKVLLNQQSTILPYHVL